MRDSQRQKVYDAETAWGIDAPKGGQFGTVDECQMMVDSIWSDKRVQKAFPVVKGFRSPRVSDGRGKTRASANLSRIWLPRFTRNGGYILHEVAHSIERADARIMGGYLDRAWHGPEWCKIYLKLVEIFLGYDEKLALFRCMRQHRVKVNG